MSKKEKWFWVIFVMLLVVLILLMSRRDGDAQTETFHATYLGAGALDGTSLSDAWDYTAVYASSNWSEADAEDGDFGLNDKLLLYDDDGDFVCRTTDCDEIIKIHATGTRTIAAAPGETPVINAIASLPGWDSTGNWTQDGGADRWSIDSSAWKYDCPRRLWISGNEGQQDESAAAVLSAGEWFCDTAADTVYVYATSNPASAYTAMTGLQNVAYGIRGNNVSGYTLEGLTVRGGYYAGIYAPNASDITITDNTIQDWIVGVKCIGALASPYTVSENVTVTNNTVDSRYPDSLHNDFAAHYLLDGISFQSGVDGGVIANNIIIDAGHANIQLTCPANDQWSPGIRDIDVYGNDISAENMSYSHPLAITYSAGIGGLIDVYENYFHDVPQRIQMVGYDIDFYKNRMKNVTGSTRDTGIGQGIILNAWSFGGYTLTSNNIRIQHNVFENIKEPCIEAPTRASDYPSTTITIRNNVFSDCATSTEKNYTYSYYIADDTDINTWDVDNNLMYNSSRGTGTDEVYYRGTAYTVAEFNTAESNSDTHADNIQSDPLLNSGDLTLTANSPAIDAGTNIGWGNDMGYRETTPIQVVTRSTTWGSHPVSKTFVTTTTTTVPAVGGVGIFLDNTVGAFLDNTVGSFLDN